MKVVTRTDGPTFEMMHPDEVQFRLAIARDPSDLLTWDVFADWLQDRDDVRHEAARLMRLVRIWGYATEELHPDGEPVGYVLFRFWSFWDSQATGDWWFAVTGHWRDYDPSGAENVGKRFKRKADALLALLDAWVRVGAEMRAAITEMLPEKVRRYEGA